MYCWLVYVRIQWVSAVNVSTFTMVIPSPASECTWPWPWRQQQLMAQWPCIQIPTNPVCLLVAYFILVISAFSSYSLMLFWQSEYVCTWGGWRRHVPLPIHKSFERKPDETFSSQHVYSYLEWVQCFEREERHFCTSTLILIFLMNSRIEQKEICSYIQISIAEV